MTAQKHIGVFGGTFDPVHNAHLDIAHAAIKAAELDSVLFVVSARPPHKESETVATPQQRLAMVELELGNEPQLDPCSLEIERPGPSYMADTLDQLQEHYPDAQLYLIIGEDSLIDLPQWKDPERILERANLLVVPRPGLDDLIPESLKGHFIMLPFEEMVVSSTDIRRRIAAGEPTDDCLPQSVRTYIQREGIYDAQLSDTPRR